MGAVSQDHPVHWAQGLLRVRLCRWRLIRCLPLCLRAGNDAVCENSAVEFSAGPPLAGQGRRSELGSLAGRPVFTGAGYYINLLAQSALVCGAMWNRRLCIDGRSAVNLHTKNGRSGQERREGDDGSGDGPHPPEVEIGTLVVEERQRGRLPQPSGSAVPRRMRRTWYPMAAGQFPQDSMQYTRAIERSMGAGDVYRTGQDRTCIRSK